MRLFLFAIGGTGARVVRSMTMMLAAGINGIDSTTEIIPIIIDCDHSNADKTRAINALRKYAEIHNALYPSSNVVYDDHFFMASINTLQNTGVTDGLTLYSDYDLYFGPKNSSIQFADYLGMSSLKTDPNKKITFDLLNALYDNSDQKDRNAELNLELNLGFKGKPNIGSVVFHELRTTDELKKFFNTFGKQEDDRVFIIGSIFGGTGASGLPEIVKAIREHSNSQIKQAPIGACIVMPYFGLGEPQPDSDDTGAIDAHSFAAKTVAALGYYAQGLNDQINAMYYVGDKNTDDYTYSEGSERQENRAHVVEMIGALSIFDFIRKPISSLNKNASEFGIINEKKDTGITLDDFYDKSHAASLDDFSAFVLATKYYRDVICGDRNKISSTSAFYSNRSFDLAGKLRKGVYALFDDFIDANFDPNAKGQWGLYPWLSEMERHTHKLTLYNTDKKKKINDFLIGKSIKTHLFSSSFDDKITARMNEKSKKLNAYDEQAFFKTLHDVAKDVYLKIK